MEFQEVIRRRRMVRRYETTPVPEDAVARIAAATLRGPTAGFSQGIDVVVITGQAKRHEVVDALTDEPDPDIPLYDAPVLLVITVDEDRYHRRYNEPDKLALGDGKEIGWPVPYWYVDAGAAMMLALLAVVDEGLAAGFYGHPDQVGRLQRVLHIPAHVVPIGVLAIGYGAEDPRSPEAQQRKERIRARRRPAAETIHRERW